MTRQVQCPVIDRIFKWAPFGRPAGRWRWGIETAGKVVTSIAFDRGSIDLFDGYSPRSGSRIAIAVQSRVAASCLWQAVAAAIQTGAQAITLQIVRIGVAPKTTVGVIAIAVVTATVVTVRVVPFDVITVADRIDVPRLTRTTLIAARTLDAGAIAERKFAERSQTVFFSRLNAQRISAEPATCRVLPGNRLVLPAPVFLWCNQRSTTVITLGDGDVAIDESFFEYIVAGLGTKARFSAMPCFFSGNAIAVLHDAVIQNSRSASRTENSRCQ